METIVFSPREALERETRDRPLAGRRESLAAETAAMVRPNGHAVTRDEIDELWVQ